MVDRPLLPVLEGGNSFRISDSARAPECTPYSTMWCWRAEALDEFGQTMDQNQGSAVTHLNTHSHEYVAFLSRIQYLNGIHQPSRRPSSSTTSNGVYHSPHALATDYITHCCAILSIKSTQELSRHRYRVVCPFGRPVN